MTSAGNEVWPSSSVRIQGGNYRAGTHEGQAAEMPLSLEDALRERARSVIAQALWPAYVNRDDAEQAASDVLDDLSSAQLDVVATAAEAQVYAAGHADGRVFGVAETMLRKPRKRRRPEGTA